MCNLKVAKMNVQPNLIRELILYVFELDYNATVATKDICCAKSECAVDHTTVTVVEEILFRLQEP